MNGSSSVLEINVSSRKSLGVLEKIRSGNTDSTLFDDIEDDVYANCCDSYQRFAVSKEYKEYLHSIAIQTKLVEGTDTRARAISNSKN